MGKKNSIYGHWTENVQKALELLDESQIGIEEYSFIHLRTLLYSKYAHIYFHLGNKDSLEFYFAKMMEGFNTQNASHLAILLEYVELLRISDDFNALAHVFKIIDDSPGVVEVFYSIDLSIYFKIKAIYIPVRVEMRKHTNLYK